MRATSTSRDNLAREDWREYTPGPVPPHYGAPRADGRPFPAHSPGLPLLLAPALRPRRAGCCAWSRWRWPRRGARRRRLAARRAGSARDGEAALLGLGRRPGAARRLLLLPRLHRGAVGAGRSRGALRAAAGAGRRGRRGGGGPPGRGAALAARQDDPGGGGAGLIAAVRLRGRAAAAFFVAVAALCGRGYLAYYHAIFGTASPLAIYGGVPRVSSGSPAARAGRACCSTARSAFCRTRRCSCVALAGLRRGWRRARGGRTRCWPAAVVAPVLPWRMWWGGQCPPARFLVPLVPLLAAGIALRVGSRVPAPRLARWRSSSPLSASPSPCSRSPARASCCSSTAGTGRRGSGRRSPGTPRRPLPAVAGVGAAGRRARGHRLGRSCSPSCSPSTPSPARAAGGPAVRRHRAARRPAARRGRGRRSLGASRRARFGGIVCRLVEEVVMKALAVVVAGTLCRGRRRHGGGARTRCCPAA